MSLTWSKDKMPWLKHIHDYTMGKAEKYLPTENLSQFRKILTTKNVGLLVNERLINMPTQVVPELHSQLPDDLAFTKEQDDIKEPKEFDYDYLLVLTKYTVPNELISTIKPGKEPKRDDRIFYRWEDSVFEPRAVASFSYMTTFK